MLDERDAYQVCDGSIDLQRCSRYLMFSLLTQRKEVAELRAQVEAERQEQSSLHAQRERLQRQR